MSQFIFMYLPVTMTVTFIIHYMIERNFLPQRKREKGKKEERKEKRRERERKKEEGERKKGRDKERKKEEKGKKDRKRRVKAHLLVCGF